MDRLKIRIYPFPKENSGGYDKVCFRFEFPTSEIFRLAYILGTPKRRTREKTSFPNLTGGEKRK
jgi:hypothetical protein